tara:strand:- start:80 stop:397 length:318 start_codon:yes stop_codon:yes gene_type:complete
MVARGGVRKGTFWSGRAGTARLAWIGMVRLGLAGVARRVEVGRCSVWQGRWGKERSGMVGFGMVGSGSRGMLGLCGVRLGKVWQAGSVLARLVTVWHGSIFKREM